MGRAARRKTFRWCGKCGKKHGMTAAELADHAPGLHGGPPPAPATPPGGFAQVQTQEQAAAIIALAQAAARGPLLRTRA